MLKQGITIFRFEKPPIWLAFDLKNYIASYKYTAVKVKMLLTNKGPHFEFINLCDYARFRIPLQKSLVTRLFNQLNDLNAEKMSFIK